MVPFVMSSMYQPLIAHFFSLVPVDSIGAPSGPFPFILKFHLPT
jgi:hypothetical protein